MHEDMLSEMTQCVLERDYNWPKILPESHWMRVWIRLMLFIQYICLA